MSEPERPMRSSLLGLCIALLLAAPAAATTYPTGWLPSVDTIEWASADADLIVRGRIVEVGFDRVGSPRYPHWAMVEVAEAIKGGPGDGRRLRFRADVMPAATGGEPGNVLADEAIFFLNAGRGDFGAGPPGELILRRLKTGAGPVPGAVALGVAFAPGVWTLEPKVTRDPAEILARVRRSAAAAPPRPSPRDDPRSFDLPIAAAGRQPAWLTQPYFGVRTILCPRNELLTEAACAWARHPEPAMREAALDALADADTPEARRAVRGLLNDPAGVLLRQGIWTCRIHPLREHASGWLAKRREAHDAPALAEPRARDARWVPLSAALAAGLLALASALVARHARLRRIGTVRLFALAASLAATILVAGLWWRSHRTFDEVEMSTPGKRYRAGSLHDGLWLLVMDSPTMSLDAYHHYPATDELRQRWAMDDVVTKRPPRRVLGFLAESGQVRAAAWMAPATWLPVRVLRVPYWAVTALVAAYPVLVGSRAARRGLVVRLRRRAGRCEHCGYDLRGNPGAACPECGQEQRAEGRTA